MPCRTHTCRVKGHVLRSPHKLLSMWTLDTCPHPMPCECSQPLLTVVLRLSSPLIIRCLQNLFRKTNCGNDEVHCNALLLSDHVTCSCRTPNTSVLEEAGGQTWRRSRLVRGAERALQAVAELSAARYGRSLCSSLISSRDYK